MTVAELIEHLEQCDPAAEVRIAHQPSYPLAIDLGGVTPDELDATVYLLEAPFGRTNYAPSELWERAQ